MSDDMFDGPGSATGISWSDYEGRLLLVKAHEKDVTVNTSFGESKAIRADVTVLDGPGSPEEISDTLIFPKVLQSQVSGNAGSGKSNLGRLGKGTAKPGQSAPWMLGEPTEDDKNTARAYMASQTEAPF